MFPTGKDEKEKRNEIRAGEGVQLEICF